MVESGAQTILVVTKICQPLLLRSVSCTFGSSKVKVAVPQGGFLLNRTEEVLAAEL